ncbi:MAG: 5-formyltetrahydrofolate cyclo-ligase [Spirochaetaceae bacterium]|nr:5-formyltetrahydrofolate cyclo-ligase [Spirochaetaceae bacterium]
MDKKNVRNEIYRYYKGLSEDEIRHYSREATSLMINQKLWLEAQVILIFLSFRKEFHTGSLIEASLDRGKKVAVPRIYGREMRFHFINSLSDEFTLNKWGIREPRESAPLWSQKYKKTLMLTPGLAFNLNGGRLGRGGGFYDRFLSEFGKDIQTTGLCFEKQIRDDFPVGSQDYRIQFLCSNRKFYSV